MTKEELLADLLGRDFIRSIATPKAQPIYEDGTIPYQVNICEFSQKSATYRNVNFYVMDEGLESEAAYYMNGDVKRTLENTEFEDFVSENISVVEPLILGFKPLSMDDDIREGVVKAIVLNDTGTEGTTKSFHVKDIGGNLVVYPLDLPPSVVAGITAI